MPTHHMTPSLRRRRVALATACAGAAIAFIGTTGLAAVAAEPSTEARTAERETNALIAESVSVLQPLAMSTRDAQLTLADAESALESASAVTTEVAESGLSLGEGATSVDTAALASAIERLSAVRVVPALLFPEVAAEAEAQTRIALAATAEVDAALEAARTQKAAEEAAAEAQRQAEAAAAAEAQRQAELRAAANTPDGARAVAQQMAAERYGWGGDQFSCLNSLWQKESNWNYQAYNASSGATGIPQSLPGSKMASAGADWQTNAATQISWGLDYISRAYGTPCAAWGKSQSVNWY